MTTIKAIHAEEIADSRGRLTLSVTVMTEAGAGTFQVPSGDAGSAEAFELRDADGRMGSALRHIHTTIAPALIGKDAADQRAVDTILRALDPTPRTTTLGGNTLIGVSVAAAKAASGARGVPVYAHLREMAAIAPSRRVPYLYCDYFRGGLSSKSPVAFQEHMLVPQTESVSEALMMLEKTQEILHRILEETFGPEVGRSLADDGAFELREAAYEPPFKLLEQALVGAELQDRVRIALDAAATFFYADGRYRVGGRELSRDELRALYIDLVRRYRLFSIEDPFAQSDAASFATLQADIPDVPIVGDDITVTDAARIRAHAEANHIRAVVIKPNQIGTLSETLDAMKAARECGLDIIVSHRGGETMDDFLADLAFAFGVFGLKAGSLRRPERRAKYERLQAIAMVQ